MIEIPKLEISRQQVPVPSARYIRLMGLIECYECGHQVSDQAAACPNCAAPIRRRLQRQRVIRRIKAVVGPLLLVLGPAYLIYSISRIRQDDLLETGLKFVFSVSALDVGLEWTGLPRHRRRLVDWISGPANLAKDTDTEERRLRVLDGLKDLHESGDLTTDEYESEEYVNQDSEVRLIVEDIRSLRKLSQLRSDGLLDDSQF